jgi:hypothetical protein
MIAGLVVVALGYSANAQRQIAASGPGEVDQGRWLPPLTSVPALPAVNHHDSPPRAISAASLRQNNPAADSPDASRRVSGG